MYENKDLYLSHMRMAPPLFLHDCKQYQRVTTNNKLSDFTDVNLK